MKSLYKLKYIIIFFIAGAATRNLIDGNYLTFSMAVIAIIASLFIKEEN